jgi:hypothetical protein
VSITIHHTYDISDRFGAGSWGGENGQNEDHCQRAGESLQDIARRARLIREG